LKPIVISSLTAVLLAVPVGTLLLGCENSEPASPSTDTPAFAQLPATGHGNKEVIPIDVALPSVDCGGGKVLQEHANGWLQVRVFDQPKNVELDVFHSVITFTNSAGETFRLTDVGPDRVYFDGENLVVALMGRIASENFIGRLVFNANTGEVEFAAGKDNDINALACQALT
jgi:hypothetical protein